MSILKNFLVQSGIMSFFVVLYLYFYNSEHLIVKNLVLFVALTFAAIYIYNIVINCVGLYFLYKKNRKDTEILMDNTIKAKCAGCDYENEVLINVAADDTTFVCEACDAKNKIKTQFFTVLMTEPLLLAQTPIISEVASPKTVELEVVNDKKS